MGEPILAPEAVVNFKLAAVFARSVEVGNGAGRLVVEEEGGEEERRRWDVFEGSGANVDGADDAVSGDRLALRVEEDSQGPVRERAGAAECTFSNNSKCRG